MASKGLNQGVQCSSSKLLRCQQFQVDECQLSTRSQIVLNPIPILLQRTYTSTSALHLIANTAHIVGTISAKLLMYYKPMYAYFATQVNSKLVRNEWTQPLQQMPLNDSRQLLTQDTQGFLALHSLPMHWISMHKVGSIKTLHRHLFFYPCTSKKSWIQGKGELTTSKGVTFYTTLVILTIFITLPSY